MLLQHKNIPCSMRLDCKIQFNLCLLACAHSAQILVTLGVGARAAAGPAVADTIPVVKLSLQLGQHVEQCYGPGPGQTTLGKVMYSTLTNSSTKDGIRS